MKESLTEKIDNTGNVRDWPSEDILAYYAIQKGLALEMQTPLRVLELGAGKSGLIGFAFAAIAKHNGFDGLEVIVTDGNTKCVESLR